MISRIWHGLTTPEKADEYETLLENEIFVNMRNRLIDGHHGIHLLRRDLDDEAEFVTMIWFDNFESVRAFSGEDHEAAAVPARRERCFPDSMLVLSNMRVKAEIKT